MTDISTYSNVAYDMVRYRTEAGEDGTGSSSEDGSQYATICHTPNSIARPNPQEYEIPVTNPPAPDNPAAHPGNNTPGYVNVNGEALISEAKDVVHAQV